MFHFILTFAFLSNQYIWSQDTEAPSVISTTPENNALDLTVRNVNLTTIKYNEFIVEPSTGYDSLVSINPSVTLNDVTFSNSQNTLEIEFLEALLFDTEYTVTITGAKDAAGNVAESYSYSFTTGSATSINTLILTEELCIEGEAALSQIVISEGAPGNFFNPGNEGSRQNILLHLPDNFEFITDGATSLSVNNGNSSDIPTDDLSFEVLSTGANAGDLLIGFERGNITDSDFEDIIRLSNVKIRALAGAIAGDFEITLSEVDASFPGLEVSDVVGEFSARERENVSISNSTNGNEATVNVCPQGFMNFIALGGTGPYTFFRESSDGTITEELDGDYSAITNSIEVNLATSNMEDGDKIYAVSAGSASLCAGTSASQTITFQTFLENPFITVGGTVLEESFQTITFANNTPDPIPIELPSGSSGTVENYIFDYPGLYFDDNDDRYYFSTDSANQLARNYYFRFNPDCGESLIFVIRLYDVDGASQISSQGITNGSMCNNLVDPFEIEWIGEGIGDHQLLDFELVSYSYIPSILSQGSNQTWYINPAEIPANANTLRLRINAMRADSSEFSILQTINIVSGINPTVKLLNSGDSLNAVSIYCRNDEAIELFVAENGDALYYITNTNDTSGAEVLLQVPRLIFTAAPGSITDPLLPENYLPPNEDGYSLRVEFLSPQNCIESEIFAFFVNEIPNSLPETTIFNCRTYGIEGFVPPLDFAGNDTANFDLVWYNEDQVILDTTWVFDPGISDQRVSENVFFTQLVAKSSQCGSNLSRLEVIVGQEPTSHFEFTNSCDNTAYFQNQSSAGIGQDAISQYLWKFSIEDSVYTISQQADTSFSYANPGVYDVTLITQTTIGCTDTLSKLVTVFDEADVQTINQKAVYIENFSSGSNGWISTTDNNNAPATARNSSWNIRQVEGQIAWHAFNDSTGTYNDNEFSWVQSPYFNLDNWNAPKLQMDILFDTPELEGAVVQYQVIDCSNTEVERVWRTLGEQEGGLNWYNNGSISAGPGGSINGWSGLSTSQGSTTAEWETVAYNLGTVKAEAQGKLVQFRVAFASLALGGNREPSRKGFAFTNLSIVEKNRNSLIEHFTSLNLDVPDPERNRLANFANSREDVIYLQYHTIFPTPDSLHYGYHFRLNASNDHLTRSYSRYGFDKPIYTIMNGRFTNRDPFFASAWGEKQYSSESLLAAAFEMDVDYSYEEGKPLQVKVNATRTKIPVPLIDTVQGGILLTIKAAIVERVITNKNSDDTLFNVLVKLIPDHSGAALKSTWPSGETLELSEEWVVPIEATPGQFSIVTWIETAFRNEVNQYGKAMIEVFQAIEKPIDIALIPAQILSNRQTMQGNWVIYPVPAREHIKIQRQEEIYSPISWRIISTTGAMIKEGRYKGGSNAIDINIAGLNAGIYMLQMTSSEGQLQRKFVKE